jgi:hypothetical protein
MMRLSRLVLVLPMMAMFSSCATGASQARGDRGMITVGVRTDAADAAKLNFRVTIQPAGLSASIKADAGVFTNNSITAGTHVVRLLDVPARCRVADGAERTVTISQQRRNAVVRFDVDCR